MNNQSDKKKRLVWETPEVSEILPIIKTKNDTGSDTDGVTYDTTT